MSVRFHAVVSFSAHSETRFIRLYSPRISALPFCLYTAHWDMILAVQPEKELYPGQGVNLIMYFICWPSLHAFKEREVEREHTIGPVESCHNNS